MSELAHGAMLVGALGAAACVATGRRTALAVAASAAMLAAMTDMAVTRLVPPLAWTAVLLGLGGALGARRRPIRASGQIAILPQRRSHALHHALAFIVGAWAFAVNAAAGRSGTDDLHAHAAVGGGSAFIVAALAMIAFGGWLVVAECRSVLAARAARGDDCRRRIRTAARHAAEAASRTVMLAAMAVPGIVASLG